MRCDKVKSHELGLIDKGHIHTVVTHIISMSLMEYIRIAILLPNPLIHPCVCVCMHACMYACVKWG